MKKIRPGKKNLLKAMENKIKTEVYCAFFIALHTFYSLPLPASQEIFSLIQYRR